MLTGVHFERGRKLGYPEKNPWVSLRSTETRPADVIELKDSLLGVYVVVKTRNLEANKASQVLIFLSHSNNHFTIFWQCRWLTSYWSRKWEAKYMVTMVAHAAFVGNCAAMLLFLSDETCSLRDFKTGVKQLGLSSLMSDDHIANRKVPLVYIVV